jgi:hypothetical protein
LDGTTKETPFTIRSVMMSLFLALEKLVEMEPLPTPFCGIVNVNVSSKLVFLLNESKNTAVIDGVKGVPFVMKKFELPIGKVVAFAAGANATAATPPAKPRIVLRRINNS